MVTNGSDLVCDNEMDTPVDTGLSQVAAGAMPSNHDQLTITATLPFHTTNHYGALLLSKLAQLILLTKSV